VLQQAGLLPASAHTNSVDQLDDTLRARGWTAVDPSQARPGDVVIIQGGGVSHTVMVESNDNGRLRLIGSNNINADGSQQVSVGGAAWALRNGGVILTPPTLQ
jgi:cell wall-associated NlpC family hydrolase